MKLLAFCLLLGMSAQAQNIPWDTTEAVTSCYARYSGLCQTSPLTAAEKAADEIEKQIDGLLLELGDRRDLSAADVLYIGETTRKRMFNGGEELLKDLQQIKKRAERAAQRAADETDGKPPNLAIFGVSTWDDGPPHKHCATVIMDCIVGHITLEGTRHFRYSANDYLGPMLLRKIPLVLQVSPYGHEDIGDGGGSTRTKNNNFNFPEAVSGSPELAEGFFLVLAGFCGLAFGCACLALCLIADGSRGQFFRSAAVIVAGAVVFHVGLWCLLR